MHLKIITGLSLLAITVGMHTTPRGNSIAAALHNEISAAEVLPHDSDPISGEWDVSFYVEGSATPATFNLKLDGHKITGTALSAHTGPGTLTGGLWSHNKLSFTVEFKNHESIAINGTLVDGKLTGEFRTEGFVARWEAKKKLNSSKT